MVYSSSKRTFIPFLTCENLQSLEGNHRKQCHCDYYRKARQRRRATADPLRIHLVWIRILREADPIISGVVRLAVLAQERRTDDELVARVGGRQLIRDDVKRASPKDFNDA